MSTLSQEAPRSPNLLHSDLRSARRAVLVFDFPLQVAQECAVLLVEVRRRPGQRNKQSTMNFANILWVPTICCFLAATQRAVSCWQAEIPQPRHFGGLLVLAGNGFDLCSHFLGKGVQSARSCRIQHQSAVIPLALVRIRALPVPIRETFVPIYMT